MHDPRSIGTLRHPLSVVLMLMAFMAFILLPLAHARPVGPGTHHAAMMIQPCAHGHMADHVVQAAVKPCVADMAGHNAPDCCQACLTAAIASETQTLPRKRGGAHPASAQPTQTGRSPPGILRPPRPIIAA